MYESVIYSNDTLDVCLICEKQYFAPASMVKHFNYSSLSINYYIFVMAFINPCGIGHQILYAISILKKNAHNNKDTQVGRADLNTSPSTVQKCVSWGSISCYTLVYTTNNSPFGERVMNYVISKYLPNPSDSLRLDYLDDLNVRDFFIETNISLTKKNRIFLTTIPIAHWLVFHGPTIQAHFHCFLQAEISPMWTTPCTTTLRVMVVEQVS